MGDPRNPHRVLEEWSPKRLMVLQDHVEGLPSYVVLSGGWAWHYMSPPHTEYKLLHDHKDVDLFVRPQELAVLMNLLANSGFERTWTRFDSRSKDFYRYSKIAEGDVKVILDVFCKAVPYVEVGQKRVVDPAHLITLYGEIHSTEDCVAVLAAKKLLDAGVSPIGRKELITMPK